MGPYINVGGRVFALIDNELVDITNALDDCVSLAVEEPDDEEIPFCDEMDDFDICEECEYPCEEEEPPMWGIPDVRRVVFNGPATIVFWDDDTKTVVKCMEGEKFERYAGFAMACMKKMFGSTSRAKAVMEECDATESKPQSKETKPKAKSVSVNDLIDAFVSSIKTVAENKKEDKTHEASAE